ncbi:TAT-variant-translocated molybdopterin oxidoreductase [Stieleria varia]|uniref:Tetrathionate reductase subunit B n=1 Tax=Stieleria varia TaxID=2528005 RepID=A0A5C6AYC4_9BACT|nr:TAT-variant-translocated molybdopterin oxidoreductase [Stieleria varia]TWU04963.1 Tetrathionate reductase subunit B precursor [Stieleria varia]
MTLNDLADQKTESSATQDGPRYWRSFAELQDREDFQQYLDREFPVAASEFPAGVSRRRWIQLMGASLAMAGATGCRYPEETIAPFVIRPEGRVPGETYSRATNFELADRVYNVLINCVDGRPLKIEANPLHPAGGGTDVFSQASILTLFDPDRSRGDDGFVLRRGPERRMEVDWSEFDEVAPELITTAKENGDGAGFAVLMGPTRSPSIVRAVQDLVTELPGATVARYDSVGADVMRNATTTMFGKPARQTLDLAKAKVILTLEADILGTDPGFLANAKGYAANRDPDEGMMSRMYVVEGGYTATGTMADSRLALRPSQMPAFLSDLALRVEQLKGGGSHDHPAEELAFNDPKVTAAERLERFLDVLSHDIAEAGDGEAVVVVGEALGADMVAAGIAMNEKLGSLGTIQKFAPEIDGDLTTVSLDELTSKMTDGKVQTLLILGNNPVATAPSDIAFGDALKTIENSIYLGDYDDETAALCTWSLPLAHPLESWGDVVTPDGHYGVCQPQILPLMGGRTACELIAGMLDADVTEGSKIVRRSADVIRGESLSEREWRKLLHDGFLDEIKPDASEMKVTGKAPELPKEAPVALERKDINQDDIEVIFTPSEALYDGRFANNAWLQEMPHSVTKLVWDNAAVMSPATAEKLQITHEQTVTLRRDGAKIQLPVFLIPGCAPGVVTAAIGYGRTRVGMVGGYPAYDVDVVGVDVSPIRTKDAMHIAYKVEGRPNYSEYEFATTQDHWAIDERGRDETERRSFSLIREGTADLMKKLPDFASAKGPHVPKVGDHQSLHTEPIVAIERDPELSFLPQWGMAIDLTKCIGCNACVIACQSENNVPIVGKEQVKNSREMHWLRIDRYFQGDEDNADVVHQPMACVHCETAPCEQVCPVAATVHTEEGINAMAYNRCIGTRYCANNCPFKVRRFNYFNYNEDVGVGYGIDAYESNIDKANRKLQSLVLNPDVTVRGRGVMEKCTYCIQRVEKGKIAARVAGRRIADGDVITACQSACPTNAIDFGNVADAESAVSKKQANERAYGMLEQLNVKPRTEYLARVRNPHRRLWTMKQIEDFNDLHSHKHGHDDHGADAHRGDGHDSAADGHDHPAEGHSTAEAGEGAAAEKPANENKE